MEVSIDKLTRNYAELSWTTVGMNFRYEIHVRSASSAESVSSQLYTPLYPNPFTSETRLFTGINPSVRYYQWRIRSVYKGFEPSEWIESDIGYASSTNDYDVNSQVEFTPATSFIEARLNNDNDQYLNSRNQIQATLVRPGFEFDPNMLNADSASYWFVTNPGFSANYGKVPSVCQSNTRVIPSVIDDVVYAFERWQEVCKISNDGGQTWQTYRATNTRLGNPVYDCICQQSNTFSYLLGYDYLIQGVSSTDIDYSHDNGLEYSHASVDLTFDRLDFDLGFGYEVERFKDLAILPPQVRQKADAFGVDDVMTVVTYANTYVWHNNRIPRIFDNVLSDLYGERIFETTGELNNEPVYFEGKVVLNDISRPDFDEDTADVCVKKIQYYDDPSQGLDYQDGNMYALVIGEWEHDSNGKRIGTSDPNNIRGVYRLNRTAIMDSAIVIGYENLAWERVYGNIQEERDLLNERSVISRDTTHLIVGHDLTKNYGEEGNPAYDNRQESSGAPGNYHSLPGSHYGTIDDPDLVLENPDVSEAVRMFSKPFFTTYVKPMSQIIATTDGDTWDYKPQDYYGAAHFNWMQRSQTRDWKSWINEIMYYKQESIFRRDFADGQDVRWKETYNEGEYLFEAPNLTIFGFNGYAAGAIIHSKNDNKVIGYYKFTYRVDITAPIRWSPERRVMDASLSNYTPVIIEQPAPDPTSIIDPTLTPLVYKMMPENYLDSDGFYKQFAKYYLDFISKGDGTAYNNVYNLLNSKNPLDDHYTEYLHKLVYERNRILEPEKRDAVVKFFLARRADFYSTKGILDSYKFLFKLLYNEQVDVEIESLNTFEYSIVVNSNDVTDDIVGLRIFTDTGNADVTYVDRHYIDGKRYWKLTLNNLIGELNIGDSLQIDGLDFTATAITGVQGDRIDYDSNEFLDRSKSYYVMKLRSELQLSQYKDDVIRFVHPIGFGFLGITLLTVLINHGISVDHHETVVDSYRLVRYDNGIGLNFTEETSLLDFNDERVYNSFGELQLKPNPLALEDPLDHAIQDRLTNTQGVTITEYNDYWSNERIIALDEYTAIDEQRYIETSTGDINDEWGGIQRTINPDYNPTAKVHEADANGSIQWGMTPYERAPAFMFDWSTGAMSISDMYEDSDNRLKDNIGNPYDPETPTQKQIGE
ncbi:baseplate wedge initiator [Vibrio phage nt-1]|uniref:Baseplate wedge initiator n=1 Tax=Vibrio phage nt-1 TaxID=115992 RepID=R9TI63_9CAUD|nr:baseplate wedge subunit [Vibrio phage nt-1]AGN30015.1 baseplate wedge initiator [Vibrio phage nt-1]